MEVGFPFAQYEQVSLVFVLCSFPPPPFLFFRLTTHTHIVARVIVPLYQAHARVKAQRYCQHTYHTSRHRGYCPVSFPLTTHTIGFITTSSSNARVISHIHTTFPTHILPCILDTRRKLPSYTRPSPVYYPPTHIPHRHIHRAILESQGSTTTYKANLPASATRTSTSSPVYKPIPTYHIHHHHTSQTLNWKLNWHQSHSHKPVPYPPT